MRHGIIVLAFGLSACSGGGMFGGSDAPDMPAYFLDTKLDISVAQSLGEVCSSTDFLDEVAVARQRSLAEQLVADGHTADELLQWQSSEELREWAAESSVAYFTGKGLDPSLALGESEGEACRIAQEEIAAGSGIGNLLEEV